MVKVRGKRGTGLEPSEYVLKDLAGPKGKRGKKLQKKLAAEALEAEKVALKKASEVVLPETRSSDDIPKPSVCSYKS